MLSVLPPAAGCVLLQIMLRSYPNLKEQEARQHLGSFGVSGPLALQPLYTLSGGQKSRVAFAKVGGGQGRGGKWLLAVHDGMACCLVIKA